MNRIKNNVARRVHLSNCRKEALHVLTVPPRLSSCRFKLPTSLFTQKRFEIIPKRRAVFQIKRLCQHWSCPIEIPQGFTKTLPYGCVVAGVYHSNETCRKLLVAMAFLWEETLECLLALALRRSRSVGIQKHSLISPFPKSAKQVCAKELAPLALVHVLIVLRTMARPLNLAAMSDLYSGF